MKGKDIRVGDYVRMRTMEQKIMYGLSVWKVIEIKDAEFTQVYKCKCIDHMDSSFVYDGYVTEFSRVCLERVDNPAEVYAHPKTITITSDGWKTTKATLNAGGSSDISAIARCSPEDEFSFEVGAKLALERLLHKAKYPENPRDVIENGCFVVIWDGYSYIFGIVCGERVVYGAGDDGFDDINDVVDGYENRRLVAVVSRKCGGFQDARDEFRSHSDLVLWRRYDER